MRFPAWHIAGVYRIYFNILDLRTVKCDPILFLVFREFPLPPAGETAGIILLSCAV